MAESGLSIGATDLRAEIGEFLGQGRGVSPAWSATQLADINRIMNSGVRLVYYPPAVQGTQAGYEWTFLRPYTTLTTVADQEDYDLPDDLARIMGKIHFPAEENRRSVPIIPVQDILVYRSSTATTGHPRFAGVRWKSTDGTDGQRQELLLWPTPDQEWVMPYQYEAYNGTLTDANPYPLGGMKMAELYIESCLAVAERRRNDDIGVHNHQFQLLLVDAIARDRRQGAQTFGQMGHPNEREARSWRRGYTGGTYEMTYNGDAVP